MTSPSPSVALTATHQRPREYRAHILNKPDDLADHDLLYEWKVRDQSSIGPSNSFVIPEDTPNSAKLSVTVRKPDGTALCQGDTNRVIDDEKSRDMRLDEDQSGSHQTTPVWSDGVAWAAAAFLTVLYLLILFLLWVALKDVFNEVKASAPISATIAASLIAVALASVLAGVFLGILEFRGKARVADKFPSAHDTTGAELLGAVDLASTLKEFRQMSNQIALLTISAVCIICATIITVKSIQ
ncbi:hypothetical protein AB0N88_23965 [Streptomyces sp. NPDC093516]|uniref:hypothetical protein n=1 Tax=Streptomyces sp. NPDC093516 TaxID=3155304 RepID=UPI0034396A29